MDERRQTLPPSGDDGKTATVGDGVPGTPGTPCTVTSPSREREAEADSAARLMEAVSEYKHTVSRLLAAVLQLCLPGGNQGMGDADGSLPNRTGKEKRPNG